MWLQDSYCHIQCPAWKTFYVNFLSINECQNTQPLPAAEQGLIQNNLVVFVILPRFVLGTVVLNLNLSQVTKHHHYQIFWEVAGGQKTLTGNSKLSWRAQGIIPEGLMNLFFFLIHCLNHSRKSLILRFYFVKNKKQATDVLTGLKKKGLPPPEIITSSCQEAGFKINFVSVLHLDSD